MNQPSFANATLSGESLGHEYPGSTEMWVDCVVSFRKWFRSNVGRPKSMAAAAETRGHNRAMIKFKLLVAAEEFDAAAQAVVIA